MVKRTVKKVEYERSSGNVFRDLGIPDADELKIASGRAKEIDRKIRSLGGHLKKVSPLQEPPNPA